MVILFDFTFLVQFCAAINLYGRHKERRTFPFSHLPGTISENRYNEVNVEKKKRERKKTWKRKQEGEEKTITA